MTIHVTQEHIDKGKARVCGRCPIALALNDATNLRWFVHPFSAYNNHHYYPLPTDAKIFIRDFDEGILVSPFSFELPIERI